MTYSTSRAILVALFLALNGVGHCTEPSAATGQRKDVITYPVQLIYSTSDAPKYPAEAKKLKQQGVVVLNAKVELDGTASEVIVDKSSGYPLLDNSARESVKNGKFTPGKLNGQPESMWHRVPVSFQIE